MSENTTDIETTPTEVSKDSEIVNEYGEIGYECRHCGWLVFNLPDRIDIEWWSDNDCGCEREVV